MGWHSFEHYNCNELQYNKSSDLPTCWLDSGPWGQSCSHSNLRSYCFAFFQGMWILWLFQPKWTSNKTRRLEVLCDHRDTLTVREIDDSLSKLFLHPVPNKEFIDGVFNAPVCSNCWIVVHDQSYNVTKFSKDGEFVWQMKPSTSIRCFCFDSSDLLYCATSDQVKV